MSWWGHGLQKQSSSVCSSDELQLAEKEATPRGPKQDPPGKCPSTSESMNWRKLLLLYKGRSVLQESVKFLQHTRSVMKQGIFCFVPLHSVPALRGSTPWSAIRPNVNNFFSTRQRNCHLELQNVRMYSRVIHWNACKMFWNWGYLIKGTHQSTVY